MTLDRILPYAKYLLHKSATKGDSVIDATCGNGFDTLFLSGLVGPGGMVYAFDVQTDAIKSTQAKLDEKKIENVVLIHDGHEHVLKYISGEIAAAIFNLGYLPGSDKSVTTHARTTWAAVTEMLKILKKNGTIILVVYHGHETGKIERAAIEEKISTLDAASTAVLRYEFLNKSDAPYIIAIEKTRA